MADHPIIFSAPMVRALLDGRKTQTRRLAWRDLPSRMDRGVKYKHTAASQWQRVKPGDRLWVQETFSKVHEGVYSADIPLADERAAKWARRRAGSPSPWLSGRYMPRQSSRLTLVVTATRIERLNDISEMDAQAEGVTPIVDHGVGNTHLHGIAFEQLWERLHGNGSWLANPEVVALTFTVHQQHIDALAQVAA